MNLLRPDVLTLGSADIEHGLRRFPASGESKLPSFSAAAEAAQVDPCVSPPDNAMVCLACYERLVR